WVMILHSCCGGSVYTAFELLEPFSKAIEDPGYWRAVTILLPSSPESWVLVATPLALLIAYVLVVLFTADEGPRFTIKLRETVPAGDDWNIVTIRRSTAQKIWDPEAKSGLVNSSVRFVSNGRSQTGRLRINQSYDEDALEMSHRMASDLG